VSATWWANASISYSPDVRLQCRGLRRAPDPKSQVRLQHSPRRPFAHHPRSPSMAKSFGDERDEHLIDRHIVLVRRRIRPIANVLCLTAVSHCGSRSYWTNYRRHGWACPGHPSLPPPYPPPFAGEGREGAARKTWMPATSADMTQERWFDSIRTRPRLGQKSHPCRALPCRRRIGAGAG
jgi:hypothetical protein